VRRKAHRPLRKPIDSRFLRRYAHLVTSANTGAVLRDPYADAEEPAPVAAPAD